MSYDGKILARAREHYESNKARHGAAFRQRRREIYAKLPRVAEIDRALRAEMAQVISASLRHGSDPAAEIERLQKENLSLQRERAQLLTAAGYDAGALTETPACAACKDTGYGEDGSMCECLKKYYIAEQNRELSKLLNIGEQSFDSFNIDYYPKEDRESCGKVPYDHMEKVRKICYQYAVNFGSAGTVRNLFLTGAPGLGKTFLSACIAREVSEHGFSVVYDTATHIFNQFEIDKFRRGGEEEQEEAAADVRRYLACDLLIMDDLGTELTTPFIQDALYQLINSRIVSEKGTVINSNLTREELYRRYLPQIASRLSGEYWELTFLGDDIRKLKQRKGF